MRKSIQFEKNPLLQSTHKFQREIVYDKFTNLEGKDFDDILSLFPYFEKRPVKYYSFKAYEEYYKFLNEMAKENEVLFTHFFGEKGKAVEYFG